MFDPLIVRTLSKLLIIFLFSFKNVHLSVPAIVVRVGTFWRLQRIIEGFLNIIQ